VNIEYLLHPQRYGHLQVISPAPVRRVRIPKLADGWMKPVGFNVHHPQRIWGLKRSFPPQPRSGLNIWEGIVAIKFKPLSGLLWWLPAGPPNFVRDNELPGVIDLEKSPRDRSNKPVKFGIWPMGRIIRVVEFEKLPMGTALLPMELKKWPDEWVRRACWIEKLASGTINWADWDKKKASGEGHTCSGAAKIKGFESSCIQSLFNPAGAASKNQCALGRCHRQARSNCIYYCSMFFLRSSVLA